MNNLLMWVAGLLVAAFAALFAVPPLVDWNQFRGVFEEEASRLLGREVRVGGQVNLRILPVPYVYFEKVSISDAPGLSGAFLRAERFTMLLSAPPLLRGVMEARQLEIDSPEIRLRFDENGGGNWQQLEIRNQEFAFVPTDVSLQSAMIRNGRILLLAKDDSQIAALDNVSGELSAKGLRGPYKFNGSLKVGKNEHTLRLSTASMDANGQMRFKLSARSKATETEHRIDGQIENIDTTPRVTGKLEARGPVLVGRNSLDGNPAFYDLSGSLNLDTRAADLTDMAISFDSAGRPQLLVGAARATWEGGLKVSSKLTSKWLDLDAISAGKTSKSPVEALAFLTGDALDAGPNGQANFHLELGQASLGGEVVSALNVRLIEKAGKVYVDHISGQLPGRTQLRANGQVILLDKGLGGSGQLLLNGDSLEKFLGWLQLDAGDLKGRAAGAFQFSADVAVKPKNVTIANARMRFAAGISRGSFEFDWNNTPRIKLQADGEHIDVSGLGSRLLAPESIAYVLGVGEAARGKSSPALEFLRKYDLDLDLDVRDMTDGEQVLTDVGVRMARTGKAVRFSRTRLTFQPGLELEVEGNVDHTNNGAVWDLSGLIAVQNSSALAKLHGLVGNIIKQPDRPRFLNQAAPVSAAFLTKAVNTDGKWNSSLSLDGTLGSDRLRFTANSAGLAADWRSNPLNVDLKVDGYAEQALLKLLNWSNGSKTQAPKNGASGAVAPSLFRMKLSGVPNKQLKASAALAGEAWQLRLRANGQPSSQANKPYQWDGSGWLQTGDMTEAVRSVAPSWLQLVRARGGLEGDFQFQGQPGQWTVEPIQVQLGNSIVSGKLDVKAAGDGRDRPMVSGRIDLNKMDADPVYMALLKGDKPLLRGASTDERPQPIWPDSPFNLEALQLFDADVQIGTQQLRLSPSLIVSNVSSRATVTSGALSLRVDKGTFWGGSASGSVELSPEQAGARLALDLSVKDARIRRLTTGGLLAQKLNGRADVKLTATGKALSPRALAIALTGSGTAKVKGARVPGLAPAQLTKVADGIVLAEADAEDLGGAITGLVETGTINLGSRDMKLTLRDGTLVVSPFVVARQTARAANKTSIDVVRGVIDSQWEIPTRLKRAIAEGVDPRKPLPPVRIVYSGVLGQLSAVAPQVSIGDLQRELTVQRMENDVRRLERQRREDEERARAETERLQRLEQERLEALEEERRKRQSTLPQPAAAPANPDGGNTLNSQGGTVERQALPPINPGQQPQSGQPTNGGQGAVLQQPLADSNQTVGPVLPAAPPRPRRVKPKPPPKKFDPFKESN